MEPQIVSGVKLDLSVLFWVKKRTSDIKNMVQPRALHELDFSDRAQPEREIEISA